jgi:hypothetical protein
MKDSERKKYVIANKAHGSTLFIQMILIIIGIVIGILELISGTSDKISNIDIIIVFLFLVGYSCYGYRFHLISFQLAIIFIAMFDLVFVSIMIFRGSQYNYLLPVLFINCLLIAASFAMRRSYELSQILFGTCLGMELMQFVIKLNFEPDRSVLYYAMSFQWVILDMTLLLINYSRNKREKIAKGSNENT